LPDGAALKTFKGHSGAVHSVAISRDGKLLASAGANVFGHGTIALWRLPDGALVKTLDDDPGPKDIARSVEISADGKLLVSAGYDETIKLWDLPNRAFRTCFIDTQFAQ
jgi:WD40 repeat protein